MADNLVTYLTVYMDSAETRDSPYLIQSPTPDFQSAHATRLTLGECEGVVKACASVHLCVFIRGPHPTKAIEAFSLFDVDVRVALKKLVSITLSLDDYGPHVFTPENTSGILPFLCHMAPYVNTIHVQEDSYPHLWGTFFGKHCATAFPNVAHVGVSIYAQLRSAFIHRSIQTYGSLLPECFAFEGDAFLIQDDFIDEYGPRAGNTLDNRPFFGLDAFERDWVRTSLAGLIYGADSHPDSTIQQWLDKGVLAKTNRFFAKNKLFMRVLAGGNHLPYQHGGMRVMASAMHKGDAQIMVFDNADIQRLIAYYI